MCSLDNIRIIQEESDVKEIWLPSVKVLNFLTIEAVNVLFIQIDKSYNQE